MAKVVVMDHPLIQHKIGYIRRKETGTKDFRQTISEIAMLICYEATRDLQLSDVKIETPICETTVKELKGKKMAIVPILRAGLGMVDGVLQLIPAAKVGTYRSLQGSGNLKPCRILLQASRRLCGKRSICGRPHAGNRRFFRSGYPDVKGQRLQENPLYVHYRSTRRRGKDEGSTSRCRYVYRCAG